MRAVAEFAASRRKGPYVPGELSRLLRNLSEIGGEEARFAAAAVLLMASTPIDWDEQEARCLSPVEASELTTPGTCLVQENGAWAGYLVMAVPVLNPLPPKVAPKLLHMAAPLLPLRMAEAIATSLAELLLRCPGVAVEDGSAGKHLRWDAEIFSLSHYSRVHAKLVRKSRGSRLEPGRVANLFRNTLERVCHDQAVVAFLTRAPSMPSSAHYRSWTQAQLQRHFTDVQEHVAWTLEQRREVARHAA